MGVAHGPRGIARLTAPTRAVIITGPASSAVGGITTHVLQLMRSSLTSQFYISHFCAGGPGVFESRAGRLRRRVTTPIAWIERLLRDGRPLVHINTVLDRKGLTRDAVLLCIAKVIGCPVVWQVHGGRIPSEFCRSRYTRRLLRAVLALADSVVVISGADASAYRTFVAPERLLRIRNGVDSGEFEAERITDAARPLQVVFLGRLLAAKGILDAIDTIAIVRAQGVPVALKIAGSGPARDEVVERIRHYGLGQEIELLEGVFASSKRALLAQSDVFVLPTCHAERMPYALLEAMAAGVVPIVCATGDIQELVVSGEHGFIVPPRRPDLIAAAIIRLSQDRASLTALSRACQVRVRQLNSMAIMADEFRRLYMSMCRG